MDEYNFNFHDLLHLRVRRPPRHAWRRAMEPVDLNFRYRWFETAPVPVLEPELELTQGSFSPDLSGCVCLDHTWWVRADYLYVRYASGLLRWEAELQGLNTGKIKVNFNGCILGRPSVLLPEYLPQTLLIYPLLEYLFVRRGAFLLHAAGVVAPDGEALLLAGRDGSFKTSLVLEMLQRGYSYLGDDLVLITRDGKARCLPTYLKEFVFRREILRGERYRGWTDRLRHLHFQLRSEFAPRNPGFEIADSASIKRLVMLSRGNSQSICVRDDPDPDREQIATRLISNLALERSFTPGGLHNARICFRNLANAYAFVFPESALAQHDCALAELMYPVLAGLPVAAATVPQRADPALFCRICDRLEEIN